MVKIREAVMSSQFLMRRSMPRENLVMLRLSVLLTMLLLPVSAFAQPAQVVIARHGEKLDSYALCDIGTKRAQALAAQYLGRGATKSLFGAGHKPDAMLAMTMHTIETITPSAQSWNMPVTAYAVIPVPGGKGEAENEEENQRTREAVHDLLNDPRYAGTTVVMVWEHKRIASAKLEAKYPKEQVSLRQLFSLDQIADVPTEWPDENYDYFWIVDFAPGKTTPVSFHNRRQEFSAPFDSLPANSWNERDPSRKKAGCRE